VFFGRKTSEEIEPHIARYLRNEENNSLNFLGTMKIEAIFGRSLIFPRLTVGTKKISANKELGLAAGGLKNPKKFSLTRIPSFLNARL
jgi:hypothetical protein